MLSFCYFKLFIKKFKLSLFNYAKTLTDLVWKAANNTKQNVTNRQQRLKDYLRTIAELCRLLYN